MTAAVPYDESTLDPDLRRAIAFLREVGIPVRIKPGARGFIEGVRVRRGGLVIDPSTPVSNVLHEAGHLACIPQNWRAQANDQLFDVVTAMLDAAALAEPDSPLWRAVIQCNDPEATAWAWAAGKHLGIPEERIILDHEYSGEGAIIRSMLGRNAYIGINGLAYAGFCVTRPGPLEAVSGLPPYPKLAMWVQREVELPATPGATRMKSALRVG